MEKSGNIFTVVIYSCINFVHSLLNFVAYDLKSENSVF
jgi:hypothetical protein